MRAPLSHRLPHVQPRYGFVRRDAYRKGKGSCGVVHNFAFSGVVFVMSDRDKIAKLCLPQLLQRKNARRESFYSNTNGNVSPNFKIPNNGATVVY